MKSVLIIENDPDTIELLEAIVNHMSLRPVCVGEPIDADYVDKLNPSIVLLDYWLDGVFGSDFCRELKANPLTSHIPVLMLSASHDLQKIAEDCGADAYLSKPFDINILEEKILEFIR